MHNNRYLNWEELEQTWDNVNLTWDNVIEKCSEIWNNINIPWDQIDATWDELCLMEEVHEISRKKGGGLSSDYIKGNPWDISKKEVENKIGKDKTNKFIKLVCRINGIDYEDSVEIKDVKVKAKDLKKTLNESKVEIKLNLENNI